MHSALVSSLVFIIFISRAFSATDVKTCKTPAAVPFTAEIENCGTPPCVVKRGTVSPNQVVFTPDQDYEKLHVILYGELLGIKRPFPGVDGKEACDYLYTNPGKVKAGCPLKAGVEYVYSNPLNIEKSFLKVTLSTHWALRDRKGKKDIWCFDVPFKIE